MVVKQRKGRNTKSSSETKSVVDGNQMLGAFGATMKWVVVVAVAAGCIGGGLAWFVPKESAAPATSSDELTGVHSVPCHSKVKRQGKCMPQRCARAVVDNFASAEEVTLLKQLMATGLDMGTAAGPPSILDLVSGAVSHGQQFIDVYPAMRQRNISFDKAGVQAYQAVADRIRRLAEEEFGVEGLLLTSPTFFSRIHGDKPAKNIHDEYWHEHIDKKQYGSFVYTALLYLNQQGEDYTGGQFLFDDGTQTTLPQETSLPASPPVRVVPKPGKLLLFTSGEENPHHVEPVKSGIRMAVTIAFTCDPQKGLPKDWLKKAMVWSK